MNEKIKSLQIIHLAITAGATAAYFFVGKITMDSLKIQSVDSSDYIYFAIPILAFLLSNFLFKSQLKQANPKLKPEDNLGVYQTASIIRWGILEGAAFLILFMKEDLLILGLVIIAYLLFLRPTESKIIRDLSEQTTV